MLIHIPMLHSVYILHTEHWARGGQRLPLLTHISLECTFFGVNSRVIVVWCHTFFSLLMLLLLQRQFTHAIATLCTPSGKNRVFKSHFLTFFSLRRQEISSQMLFATVWWWNMLVDWKLMSFGRIRLILILLLLSGWERKRVKRSLQLLQKNYCWPQWAASES